MTSFSIDSPAYPLVLYYVLTSKASYNVKQSRYYRNHEEDYTTVKTGRLVGTKTDQLIFKKMYMEEEIT